MKKRSRGFTRLELLFVILGLGLLTLSAVSLIASNQSESQRIGCFSNLRQIGRAFQSWANDHGDRFPWVVPVAEGGTYGNHSGLLVWLQFTEVSNYLASPRVLKCPAFTISSISADTWDNSPQTGLFSVNFRNNALSYMLGLHASPTWGGSILSGDANFLGAQPNVPCSILPFSGNAANALSAHSPTLDWANSIHVKAGNLLLSDGSVVFCESNGLRTIVQRNDTENNSGVHYISSGFGL